MLVRQHLPCFARASQHSLSLFTWVRVSFFMSRHGFNADVVAIYRSPVPYCEGLQSSRWHHLSTWTRAAFAMFGRASKHMWSLFTCVQLSFSHMFQNGSEASKANGKQGNCEFNNDSCVVLSRARKAAFVFISTHPFLILVGVTLG